ncbi:MAG TPA: hypothetical protein VLU47_05120 [Blastocatellia bacterium]|nr:hypothetical protein [Blastocatellia bacterium]
MRSPQLPPRASRLVGLIFEDDTGRYSVTPCIQSSTADQARLKLVTK